MKAVVGVFNSENVQSALDALVSSGFQPDSVKKLTSADEIPAYLEGEPEKTASQGWLLGSVIGAVLGAALGWLVMSMYSMQYIVLTVLISAAAGAAIGGYLMSLYSVRADEALDMDIREALGEGRSLLVVHADAAAAERAARIMRHSRSEHVETYLLPTGEPERI